ncbi:hypothetical protein [Gordonia sp. (in: high G+C Gram-positive bacteria)]|uniref:hypothetical protein n=1 Tax=Gordonia sp. (in: high G+C Gram-positive bacteria) TaxID=84139 RepID=UPI003F965DA6
MWPVDRYRIVHRALALEHGISERQIASALRAGELRAVARGRYILASDLAGRDDAADVFYRAQCVAAATGPGRPVLSHDSAAAIHRIPLLYPDHEHVHVVTGRDAGGSRRSRRIIHAGLLRAGDVVEVDGVQVTSVARTAVDVALAAGSFPQALTVFDGAVATTADREHIERLLADRRHGVALARRAYSLADERSDSPGESWSRAQMIEAGLPVPDLQVQYRLGSGRRAFCDFGIGVVFVGEFDGLVKYRREMRGEEAPEEVVIREKIREDELRELGLDVARWVWSDLCRGLLVPKLTAHYDKLGISYRR